MADLELRGYRVIKLQHVNWRQTSRLPTATQIAILRLWMGHQKFIYNAKVLEQDYWYRFSKQSLALTGTKPSAD